ncbi:MAG TPA: NADH-quinone oxidoreductase subunit M [Bacteroidia bacterium]|nr:NADH-quinone oxidoreductase subunit M [Bacteroidia bacterium]HNT80881.1 NADH-quinone oxidoreductase subunit M [Bacteroidia bacterium]
MLTSLLIYFPIIGILFLTLLKEKNSKVVALGSSLLQLLLTAYAIASFQVNAGVQQMIDVWWIQSLGISFKAGLDGISLLMVLLTNFLMPLIILSSFHKTYPNTKLFYALILLMQSALVGVFTARDGFLFYVFWEMALIPIFLICYLWGGVNRLKITLKFFLYTLAGSLLMLLGFIYIYLKTPAPHSFDLDILYQTVLSSYEQEWLFLAFMIAFAIKIPIVPFHSWQPDTYTDAPSEGTMLLSGIMLKMGIYGIARFVIPMFPFGFDRYGELFMILCSAGVVYASFIAWIQKDFKRLIAYSSIAHVGIISAGLISQTHLGLQGAFFQMISHGVAVVGLFLIADILFNRKQTRMLDQLGGIAHHQKWFSVFFMIILLGSIAMPLTNGFVGEFLLLNGILQYNIWYAVLAGMSVIFGAVYMLQAYQKIMLGKEPEDDASLFKLHTNEKIVLTIISLVILLTGLFPQSLQALVEQDIFQLLSIKS